MPVCAVRSWWPVAELAVPFVAEPVVEGVAVSETLQGRRIGFLYAVTGVVVFALMGVLGLLMRLSQATIIHLSAAWFYRLMTLHGVGMLTATMTAMMGASWYALSPLLPLSYTRMRTAYVAIVAGVAVVLGAVLVGGFAPGWTFLYPLPFSSAGQWSDRAAAAWFIGVLLVGIGFAVYCVDVLLGVEREYGSLNRALGIRFVFGHDDSPPQPTVIAGTVIALNGLLTGAVGTTILIAEFDKTLDPSMQISPLVAKNLTYFFGHMFANMILYLAAGAVYVMVPRYCGRQWKTTRPLAIAWLGTLVFLVTALWAPPIHGFRRATLDPVRVRGDLVHGSVAGGGDHHLHRGDADLGLALPLDACIEPALSGGECRVRPPQTTCR
jgi:cytochrome c oxidase subunit I